MKKILLLGGSKQQLIAIEKSKKMGYYTIVCDYLEDNPGQYVADKFYLASTTDKEKILQIAKKEGIDGILAYASDPAISTSAYVAEKLNLPTLPFKAVDILSNKDKFRDFLRDNHFNVPFSKGYYENELQQLKIDINKFKLPVMVKPVDSSGSKGVTKVSNKTELEQAIKNALEFSRSKRIIIEEYVESFGYQVAGDGLAINGNLVFRYFGNDHFIHTNVNPFVPVSASFPYNKPKEVQDKIHETIQKLINLLQIKNSTFNFDIRIDENFNVYLMEIAPRSGGNYIPQLTKYATGIDLVEYSIRFAMGEDIEFRKNINPEGFWAYYALNSQKAGTIKDIKFSTEISSNIIEKNMVKSIGDKALEFKGANCTLGIILLKFKSMDEMLYKIENMTNFITIEIE